MNTLRVTGRAFYALGFAALGIFCIVYQDFIIGRPPMVSWIRSYGQILSNFLGAIVILSAILILIGKRVQTAALIIATLILTFSLPRHLSQFSTDWLNGFKAMALLGGSIVIAIAWSDRTNYNLRNWLLMPAILLIAAFFISGGYAHIKYAEFVITFFPSYIPAKSFFTYFCAICLFAGGIGIIIPQTRKWASLLSGIMLTGWFLLLHIPRFISDPANKSDRLGLCESLAFAGIFFTIYSISKIQKTSPNF